MGLCQVSLNLFAFVVVIWSIYCTGILLSKLYYCTRRTLYLPRVQQPKQAQQDQLKAVHEKWVEKERARLLASGGTVVDGAIFWDRLITMQKRVKRERDWIQRGFPTPHDELFQEGADLTPWPKAYKQEKDWIFIVEINTFSVFLNSWWMLVQNWWSVL